MINYFEGFISAHRSIMNNKDLCECKKILLSHTFKTSEEIYSIYSMYLVCSECNFKMWLPKDENYKIFKSFEDFTKAGFISCDDYLVKSIIE